MVFMEHPNFVLFLFSLASAFFNSGNSGVLPYSVKVSHSGCALVISGRVGFAAIAAPSLVALRVHVLK